MSFIESTGASSVVSNGFDGHSLGQFGGLVGVLNPSQRGVVAEWQMTAEDSRPSMATAQAGFTALFEENQSTCELRVTSESPQREITVLHQVVVASAENDTTVQSAPQVSAMQVAAVWQETEPVRARTSAAETGRQAAANAEVRPYFSKNRFDSRLELMEWERMGMWL